MAQYVTVKPPEPRLEENGDGDSASYSGTISSFSYPESRQIGGCVNTAKKGKPYRRQPIRILAMIEDLRMQESMKPTDHASENTSESVDNHNTIPFESPQNVNRVKVPYQIDTKSPLRKKTPSKSPLSQGMGWILEPSRRARQILRREEQQQHDLDKNLSNVKLNKTPAKVLYSTPQHGNVFSSYKDKSIRVQPLVFSHEKANHNPYSSKASFFNNNTPQLGETTPLAPHDANNYNRSAQRGMNANGDTNYKAHISLYKTHQNDNTPQHSRSHFANKENEAPPHAAKHIPSMGPLNFNWMDAAACDHFTNLKTVAEEEEPRPLKSEDYVSNECPVPSHNEHSISSYDTSNAHQQPLNLTLTSEYKNRQVQPATPDDCTDPLVDSPGVTCDIASVDQPLNLASTSKHKQTSHEQFELTDPVPVPLVSLQSVSPYISSVNPQLVNQQPTQMNPHNLLAHTTKNSVFHEAPKQYEAPFDTKPKQSQPSCPKLRSVEEPPSISVPETAEMPPPVLPVKGGHINGNVKTFAKFQPLIVNDKQYTILSRLGSGGSSIVYQAMDHATRTQVAVKIVTLTGVDPTIAQGYLNEIAVLKKLQNCDSVIRLLGHQFDKKTLTLKVVMERGDVDFANFLKDRNKTKKKVSMLMIGYYWSEMVTAVKSVHEIGIIHSDLKPANFLLVSGRLKLIDFGIAASLNKDMTSVVKDGIVGTFNYMSPEAVGNANGLKISFKSDVWSLGCILYNLVYGHTPFAEIVSQWAKVECIRDPGHVIKFPIEVDCPQVLLLTMKRCLMYNPSDRPSTTQLLQHPFLLGLCSVPPEDSAGRLTDQE